MARLRAGDPAALDPLIATHAGRVYRVALGIMGHPVRSRSAHAAVAVTRASERPPADSPA